MRPFCLINIFLNIQVLELIHKIHFRDYKIISKIRQNQFNLKNKMNISQKLILITLVAYLSTGVNAICKTGQIIQDKTEACFELPAEFEALSRFRCALGKIVLFKTFDLKGCNLEERNERPAWDNCLWSKQLNRTVCITPQMIHGIGSAAHEICNSENNGLNKCFSGNLGVIKCNGLDFVNNKFKCNF